MIFPNGACAVCTNSTPCLFDILADESERVNLASKQPAIVAQLQKQLATYEPYVSPSMSAAELSNYECLTTKTNQYTALMKEWCEYIGSARSLAWPLFCPPFLRCMSVCALNPMMPAQQGAISMGRVAAQRKSNKTNEAGS